MIGRWIFIRDGRLSAKSWIVIGVGLLLALIVLLPLRLVLGLADPSGQTLRAQAVEGPAWNGLVGEMQIGRLPLGLMEVDLMPLPLLTGEARFALERPDYPGARPFAAQIAGSGGNVRISDATGEIALSGLMAPLPVRALTMTGFNAEMRDGACQSASGIVGLVVPSLGALLPSETVLSGEARCEDGALIVPMTGPAGAERLDLTLSPDGAWNARLYVPNLPPDMAAPLIDMGFSTSGNGVELKAGGTL